MSESQIADYLSSFRVPDDYEEQILQLYGNLEAERKHEETRRWQIEARLKRLKKSMLRVTSI